MLQPVGVGHKTLADYTHLVGRELIVMCAQGYASSLAASTLRDIGVRATDMIGGFAAWRDAGLPIEPCPDRRP